MGGEYPIRSESDRTLGADYAGPVHVWDVDKTYLDTDLSGPRAFLRIPLEMAIDKRTVPGAVAVLRECRKGPGPAPRHTPLWFVTASPPQLGGVLRRRMLLDGVEPDGFVFKDQLRLALRGRFRELRVQVEYKLTALWTLIAELPPGARLVLVGDDHESDAQVFALLAAAQSGAMTGGALRDALAAAGVPRRGAGALEALAGRAAGRASVMLACVLLTSGREPEAFRPYEPAVCVAREALQLAAIMCGAGLVDAAGVARTARALARGWGWDSGRVDASLDDAAARRLAGEDVVARIRGCLVEPAPT